MAFMHIYISNHAHLSVKNGQLVISQDNKTIIPLEDIASIILENRASTISSYALSSIASAGIVLFTCDEKHMPNGILTSFNSHSRQLSVLEKQMHIPRPLQKRIWQKLIKQKIENQAEVLKTYGLSSYEYLNQLSKKVESGDKTRLESVAAARYFESLFGTSFNRHSENLINSCLNYGYALVRGLIARSLVAYGFIPALGLFHHSQLNNFNLADDFIEPYRPIVDYFAFEIVQESDSELTTQHKKQLYNIFNANVTMEGNSKYSITSSVDNMVSSFHSTLFAENHELLRLPSIIID